MRLCLLELLPFDLLLLVCLRLTRFTISYLSFTSRAMFSNLLSVYESQHYWYRSLSLLIRNIVFLPGTELKLDLPVNWRLMRRCYKAFSHTPFYEGRLPAASRFEEDRALSLCLQKKGEIDNRELVHYACRRGLPTSVNVCIALGHKLHGAHIDELIRSGNIELTEVLLAFYPNMMSTRGFTLGLTHACVWNHQMCLMLLALSREKGVRISLEGCLSAACTLMNCGTRILQLLLSDERITGVSDFSSCLLTAVGTGQIDMVQVLLSDRRVSLMDDSVALAYKEGKWDILALLLSDPRVDEQTRRRYDLSFVLRIDRYISSIACN